MRMLSPFFPTRNLTPEFFDDWVGSMLPIEPVCDVAETEHDFVLSFDIPGMKKEDLKVEIDKNVLTVSGERKNEFSSGKKEKVQRTEKSYGFFKRSFTLPATVDAEKVEAHYEDGVLRLSLPKAAGAKARRVEIGAGTKHRDVDVTKAS